jgi:hypothetical protein
LIYDLEKVPQPPSWAASLGRKSEEAGDEECVEGVLERDLSGDVEPGLEACSCAVRAIRRMTPAASESVVNSGGVGRITESAGSKYTGLRQFDVSISAIGKRCITPRRRQRQQA